MSDNQFQVVLLGDTFTGKTSLVLRFAEGYYRESARSATVGAFFITKRITVPSAGLTCKIQIWDTAGQEQFKPLAPMYYSNSAAAILCYDPASPKSMDTLYYWLDELHRNVPAGRIVIAMAACKCDLLKDPKMANSQAPQRLQQVEEMAKQMGAIFIPTSAKNNDNVTELFTQVAEKVLQYQKQNPYSEPIPVTLGIATPTNKPASSPSVGLVPRPDSTLPHNQQKPKSTSALPNFNFDQRPSSPNNSLSSGMNREDYLHRRSHHVETPESPSRIHTTTDPSKMEGSPIVITTNSPNKKTAETNNNNMAMCGDADYLTSCAAIPGAAQLANSMDQSGKCVIL